MKKLYIVGGTMGVGRPPSVGNLKGFYLIVCFLMVTGAGMLTHSK